MAIIVGLRQTNIWSQHYLLPFYLSWGKQIREVVIGLNGFADCWTRVGNPTRQQSPPPKVSERQRAALSLTESQLGELIQWVHFKDVRGLGTVWFLVAKSAHQLTDCLACGNGSPNLSLNICGCPIIPIDEYGGYAIELLRSADQGTQLGNPTLVWICGTSIEVFITRSQRKKAPECCVHAQDSRWSV
jgi:hypothetical protein